MKHLSLIVLTLLGLSAPLRAQQDEIFSHYMFNSFALNPGYAGLAGAPEFVGITRSQWLGYGGLGNGSPTTYNLTFNAPILALNSGAGINLIHDRLGPFVVNKAYASYAYHLVIGKGKLGIGARAGVMLLGIDRSDFIPPETQDDITIYGDDDAQAKPDFAVGLWYETEKYYVGTSANHLTQPKYDFLSNDSISLARANPAAVHGYVTGGYHFDPTYSLRVTPSALLRYDFESGEAQVEVSAVGVYDEQILGGLSFRQGEAIVAMVGFFMLKDKNLRFNYAFDYTTVGRDAKAPTSHEVMVTYRLPAPVPGAKPIIRTPRYRH
ncbi:MAG: type IX secretion system membrane protein PorP/SprF [Catalinimonas sp.]